MARDCASGDHVTLCMDPKGLRYGSTFTGIGGLDIAVEYVFCAAPAWHVEPDPYAAAVLRERWPDVPNLHRIEKVNGKVERPDIICGGFPCQDISLAGSGAGLDGERSGLWWELARAIGLLRPSIVVLENVAAITRRGLDAVIGELSRLGYDAAWSVVRASDVGAPHQRARTFIVAALPDPSGMRRPGGSRIWERRPEESGPRRGRGAPCERGEPVVDPDGTRRVQCGQQATAAARRRVASDPGRENARRCCENPRWPPSPGDIPGWARWDGAVPGVRRGSYGPARGVDARRRRARLRCLGNAVVPAQAAHAIRGLAERLGIARSAGGRQARDRGVP